MTRPSDIKKAKMEIRQESLKKTDDSNSQQPQTNFLTMVTKRLTNAIQKLR